jgi:hypothetical protein
MIKNIKIKPLTINQIIISLDRLTRFKPTDDKYMRVFSDIISSNLIYPKVKKADIVNMPDITSLINEIFKVSVINLGLTPSNDNSINKMLADYEQKTFRLTNETKKLLNNKIDYKSLLPLLRENLPPNLVWLKHINEKDVREKYSTGFPVKKVVLVEGITEEILLPAFAKLFGYDFDKNGIAILPAGGKNQSVKVFYSLVEKLKLPIFVLFDKDAFENAQEIKPKLRSKDFIHILNCGEFEDTLSLNHIKRALNMHFKNYYTFSISQLKSNLPMTKTLDLLFKEYNSEFKKAEFAQNLCSTIKKGDLTDSICEVLSLISR